MITPPTHPGAPTELAALTKAVRELNAAVALTEVPGGVQMAAVSKINALSNELRAASRKRVARAYNFHVSSEVPDIPSRIIVNRYNPVGPEMNVEIISPGVVRAVVPMGDVYQGPADSVHGGFSALLMDTMLGIAVQSAGHFSMTGTLSVRYLQRTPLNADLHLEARIVGKEGRKIHAEASISREGVPTVVSNAVFIEVAPS